MSVKRRRESNHLIDLLTNLVIVNPTQHGFYNQLEVHQRRIYRELDDDQRTAYSKLNEEQRKLADSINASPDDMIRSISSMYDSCPNRTKDAEMCLIRSSRGIFSKDCAKYCLDNYHTWIMSALRNLPSKVVLHGLTKQGKPTSYEFHITSPNIRLYFVYQEPGDEAIYRVDIILRHNRWGYEKWFHNTSFGRWELTESEFIRPPTKADIDRILPRKEDRVLSFEFSIFHDFGQTIDSARHWFESLEIKSSNPIGLSIPSLHAHVFNGNLESWKVHDIKLREDNKIILSGSLGVNTTTTFTEVELQ